MTSGCQNYRKVTKNVTTTTIKTTIFQKDGKTPERNINKKTVFEEDVNEKDDGFTIGSKGLGSYSIVRDIRFV